MSVELVAEVADDYGRIAERYAAELLDKIGVPATYEAAVQALAVAYLEGGAQQLKWARDKVRGDGDGDGDEARAEYRDFLRSLPEARGVRDDA